MASQIMSSTLFFSILLPITFSENLPSKHSNNKPHDTSSRVLLSEQLQSKMIPRSPESPSPLGSESVHPVSSSITLSNKWMDGMEPYSQCRSRYAIENGMFYNGAGVRSVHSDFSDSDSLNLDVYDEYGDSAEYLFREHFDDDLFDVNFDRNHSRNGVKTYSVDPASPSSSDGDNGYNDTTTSTTESGHSDHDNGDNEWLEYLGWNESHSLNFLNLGNSSNFMNLSNATNFSMNSEREFTVKTTASKGTLMMMEEEKEKENKENEGSVSPDPEEEGMDEEVWRKSMNSLSAYAHSSTESVSRLEFSRRNFLIALSVLMLNIFGIISYFVCIKMKHHEEDREMEEEEEYGHRGGSDQELIIESDPEM